MAFHMIVHCEGDKLNLIHYRGDHDGTGNVNVKRIHDEKNFNYIYLDNATEKRMAKLLN